MKRLRPTLLSLVLRAFDAKGQEPAYPQRGPIEITVLFPAGTSADVTYGELGVAAMTFEIGTSFVQCCSCFESTIKPKTLRAVV